MDLRNLNSHQDTIVALSTPPGQGALALIRLSGKQAIEIVDQFFSKDLHQAAANQVLFGKIQSGGDLIDESVLSVFRAPHSYTKEDTVEISSHASPFIVQRIIQLSLQHGARLAEAGEFTRRAYLNGQMDLAQAEAVADLIAADSASAHRVALAQMRGGFSQKIKELRENFIALAALLELELDFGEEDVEFANRDTLQSQVQELQSNIQSMANSFALGNAIKNGVPVAIVGKPNAGKSTLLNGLLEEEKAIVSNIPGTTRDYIEDEKIIQGLRFRFIDTAGLREAEDEIEKIGVARTHDKMQGARIILYLFDALHESSAEALAEALDLQKKISSAQVILVPNKMDQLENYELSPPEGLAVCPISAKEKEGLDRLETLLYQSMESENSDAVIVTNIRHYENLMRALEALEQVKESIEVGLSTELLASDIREATYHLGAITGEINNEDLLGHIFSKFCIGK